MEHKEFDNEVTQWHQVPDNPSHMSNWNKLRAKQSENLGINYLLSIKSLTYYNIYQSSVPQSSKQVPKWELAKMFAQLLGNPKRKETFQSEKAIGWNLG